MKGYRTYTGLIIALLGVLGFGNVMTQDELNHTIDLTLELVGIAGAFYGRFKANK